MRTHITGHVDGRIASEALAAAVAAMTGAAPFLSTTRLDETDETKTVITFVDADSAEQTIRVFEAAPRRRDRTDGFSTCIVARAGEREKLIVGRLVAIGGGLLIDERDGSTSKVAAEG